MSRATAPGPTRCWPRAAPRSRSSFRTPPRPAGTPCGPSAAASRHRPSRRSQTARQIAWPTSRTCACSGKRPPPCPPPPHSSFALRTPPSICASCRRAHPLPFFPPLQPVSPLTLRPTGDAANRPPSSFFPGPQPASLLCHRSYPVPEMTPVFLLLPPLCIPHYLPVAFTSSAATDVRCYTQTKRSSLVSRHDGKLSAREGHPLDSQIQTALSYPTPPL